MITAIALKRSAQFLAISAFAVLIADTGYAAYLPLQINPTPSSMVEFEHFLASRQQEMASPDARKKLFREFLRWNVTHR